MDSTSLRDGSQRTLSESPVSFRDPAGRLFVVGERIIRLVNRSAIPELDACLASPAVRQLIASGRVIATKSISESQLAELCEYSPSLSSFSADFDGLAIEHQRIPFRSFPYEWPPEMLQAAGELTLDLAENLLPEGLGLKDATAYNILFRGSKPVHVDTLSFERREAGDPGWLPFAQFSHTVLLPLLASKHFGIRLNQVLLNQRDGFEPEQVYRLCGALQRVRPPFLTLVSLPTWLKPRRNAQENKLYQKRRLSNAEKAQFILERLFMRLRSLQQQLTPRKRSQTKLILHSQMAPLAPTPT